MIGRKKNEMNIFIIRQLISSDPSRQWGRPSQRRFESRHNPSLHRKVPAGQSVTTKRHIHVFCLFPLIYLKQEKNHGMYEISKARRSQSPLPTFSTRIRRRKTIFSSRRGQKRNGEEESQKETERGRKDIFFMRFQELENINASHQSNEYLIFKIDVCNVDYNN